MHFVAQVYSFLERLSYLSLHDPKGENTINVSTPTDSLGLVSLRCINLSLTKSSRFVDPLYADCRLKHTSVQTYKRTSVQAYKRTRAKLSRISELLKPTEIKDSPLSNGFVLGCHPS